MIYICEKSELYLNIETLAKMNSSKGEVTSDKDKLEIVHSDQ